MAIGILAGIVFGMVLTHLMIGGINKKIHQYSIVPNKKDTDQIMGLFKKTQAITNENIQKLLGVSDATATRYLNKLEQRKLIKRRGKGRGAHYTKMPH